MTQELIASDHTRETHLFTLGWGKEGMNDTTKHTEAGLRVLLHIQLNTIFDGSVGYCVWQNVIRRLMEVTYFRASCKRHRMFTNMFKFHFP